VELEILILKLQLAGIAGLELLVDRTPRVVGLRLKRLNPISVRADRSMLANYLQAGPAWLFGRGNCSMFTTCLAYAVATASIRLLSLGDLTDPVRTSFSNSGHEMPCSLPERPEDVIGGGVVGWMLTL